MADCVNEFWPHHCEAETNAIGNCQRGFSTPIRELSALFNESEVMTCLEPHRMRLPSCEFPCSHRGGSLGRAGGLWPITCPVIVLLSINIRTAGNLSEIGLLMTWGHLIDLRSDIIDDERRESHGKKNQSNLFDSTEKSGYMLNCWLLCVERNILILYVFI